MWKNNSISNGSNPWENTSKTSNSNSWQNNSNSTGSNQWENTSKISKSNAWKNKEDFKQKDKDWINTASKTNDYQPWLSNNRLDTSSPWVSQVEITEFLKKNLTHLETLGGKPMTLEKCGSLQPKNLESAIIATVISTAAIVGGVALIVLSAGSATPGVAAGWGALAGTSLGVGFSGTINAGMGIHKGRFDWESWGTDVGFAGATSLITFPTCFIGGQVVAGVLVQGAKLSATAAKSIAIAAGSLAGAGIHEGSYVIKCEVEGKKIETFELILTGVGGMLEGAGAAYLGAKVAISKIQPPKEALVGGLEGKKTDVEIFELNDKNLSKHNQFFDGNMNPNKMKNMHANTGCSVSVTSTTKNAWETKIFDMIVNQFSTDSKWVRITSTSDKAIRILQDRGGNILLLEHSNLKQFSSFANNSEGLDFLKNLLNKAVKNPIKSINLVGCEVDYGFAQGLKFKMGVNVHMLDRIPGSKLHISTSGMFHYGTMNPQKVGSFTTPMKDSLGNTIGYMKVHQQGAIKDLPGFLTAV